MIAPTHDELRALARKYRTLAALRRAHAEDGSVAERPVLRALAREFPGALRELDTLELHEIDRRAEALESAAQAGPSEPWMAWLAAYHALLRAALFVKLRVASGSHETLAEEASRRAGTRVEVEFVRAVARPAGGKLAALVALRVAETFGVEPEQVRGVLGGRRRTR